MTTKARQLAEFIAAEPMRLLREERDRLIAATDWWAANKTGVI
jgi:hypothetical protein